MIAEPPGIPADRRRPGPRELPPRPAEIRRPPAARAALAHGAYLLFVGGWPLVSLRTFAKVTGPKPEGWLAKGVGACLLNVGATLVAAGARGKVSRELRILGAGTGLSFAVMDFYYAGIRRRISPVYLLNGLAQLAFAALWCAAEIKEMNAVRQPPEPAFA
ncbi:MAG: hypothetical protein ABR567_08705 [Myxococcales bacterium]|nr:hypothetical protein [Myxococcales bacterium]